MAIKFFTFFFRQSVLSDVFGLNGRHHWQSNDAVRAVAVAKRREYTVNSKHMQTYHVPCFGVWEKCNDSLETMLVPCVIVSTFNNSGCSLTPLMSKEGSLSNLKFVM